MSSMCQSGARDPFCGEGTYLGEGRLRENFFLGIHFCFFVWESGKVHPDLLFAGFQSLWPTWSWLLSNHLNMFTWLLWVWDCGKNRTHVFSICLLARHRNTACRSQWQKLGKLSLRVALKLWAWGLLVGIPLLASSGCFCLFLWALSGSITFLSMMRIRISSHF